MELQYRLSQQQKGNHFFPTLIYKTQPIYTQGKCLHFFLLWAHNSSEVCLMTGQALITISLKSIYYTFPTLFEGQQEVILKDRFGSNDQYI